MKLACKDVSATDCGYEATGSTDKEVIDNMVDHMKANHGDAMKKMGDNMRSVMEAKVR